MEVLVHPYWFAQKPFESKGFPWFDTMKAVPESYARALLRGGLSQDHFVADALAAHALNGLAIS